MCPCETCFYPESPNCVGGGGFAPFEPPLTGGHPALKFPPYSICRAKRGRKTINVFSHFHGLIPDTNYRHLECFVMLGTLSKLRRGQMSHICDISPLRVNNSKVQANLDISDTSTICGLSMG